MNKTNETYKGASPMQAAPAEKRFLTLTEAASFLGLSRSYLYQLTHTKQIPYYKNGGLRLAFDREQLTQWQECRMRYVPTEAEHTAAAEAYCAANPL